MDRFNGLDIPESLADALEPATLALIVYDMQAGIVPQVADADHVLANVLKLLAAAREHRIRVNLHASLLHAHRAGRRLSASPGEDLQGKDRAADTHPLIAHGSAGFELVEGLGPRPGEAVIDKITMSAFEGTPLDIVLRDCAVRAYLIAGVAIEVGIEPTVRHSTDLGYLPVVVRDACGAGDRSAGERALASIAFAGDALLADTDDVCSILNAAPPVVR